jgi:hypothetical protein
LVGVLVAGSAASASAISSSDRPMLRAARMNASRRSTLRSYRRWPPDVRVADSSPCAS